MGIKRFLKKFYSDFKMGLFIFVSSSYQKLEQKTLLFRDLSFLSENSILALSFDRR
jgi:hypothetical protein